MGAASNSIGRTTVMQPRHEPIDVRRRRLSLAIQDLAADLVEERRRRVLLEREVRDLRARLAVYEATNPKEDHECHPVT